MTRHEAQVPVDCEIQKLDLSLGSLGKSGPCRVGGLSGHQNIAIFAIISLALKLLLEPGRLFATVSDQFEQLFARHICEIIVVVVLHVRRSWAARYDPFLLQITYDGRSAHSMSCRSKANLLLVLYLKVNVTNSVRPQA